MAYTDPYRGSAAWSQYIRPKAEPPTPAEKAAGYAVVSGDQRTPGYHYVVPPAEYQRFQHSYESYHERQVTQRTEQPVPDYAKNIKNWAALPTAVKKKVAAANVPTKAEPAGVKRAGSPLASYTGRLGPTASTVRQVQRGELKTGSGFSLTSMGVATGKAAKTLQQEQQRQRQTEIWGAKKKGYTWVSDTQAVKMEGAPQNIVPKTELAPSYYPPRYVSTQETISPPTTQLKYDVFGKPVSIIHEHPSNLEHKWTVQTEIWKNKMWSPGLNYQYAALAVGSTFALDLFRPIRHPGQTVKSMLDPITYGETAKGLVTKTLKGDLTVIGDVGALYVGGKIIGKAPKMTGLSFETFEIPTETPTTIRTVGFMGRPIVTASSSEGVQFGRVVLQDLNKLPESVDIKPGRPLETNIYKSTMAELGQTARAKEGLVIGQTIVQRTIGIKSKFIQDRPLFTQRLNIEQSKVLLKIAEQENAQIFGSGARRLQIPEHISPFVPRDLDIKLADASPENLARVENKAVNVLTEKGAVVKISEPGVIKILTPEGWRKAVEFKGKGLIEKEPVPDYVLGVPKEGKKIRIGRNLYTALDEELRGVSQGTFRIRKNSGELDVYPSEKRIKDIYSTDISVETLIQSKILPDYKLNKAVTRFRELYTPKPSQPARVMLYDFSKSTKPPAMFDMLDLGGSSLSAAALSKSPAYSPFSSPSLSAGFRSSPSSSLFKSNSFNSLTRSSSLYSGRSPSLFKSNSFNSLTRSSSLYSGRSLSSSLFKSNSFNSLTRSSSLYSGRSLSPSLSSSFSSSGYSAPSSLSSSLSASSNSVPTSSIIPGPDLKIPELGKELSKSSLTPTRQPKKYTPSVLASLFNIRGKRPKGQFYGLEFRPL